MADEERGLTTLRFCCGTRQVDLPINGWVAQQNCLLGTIGPKGPLATYVERAGELPRSLSRCSNCLLDSSPEHSSALPSAAPLSQVRFSPCPHR